MAVYTALEALSDRHRLLLRDFSLLSTNIDKVQRAYDALVLSGGFMDEAVLVSGEVSSSSDTAISLHYNPATLFN
jgi:hypothetical protein